VWQSDLGILGMVGVLAAWAHAHGFAHVAALYLGPLAVTNAWLVLYTWLQVSFTPPLGSGRLLWCLDGGAADVYVRRQDTLMQSYFTTGCFFTPGCKAPSHLT
jgi:hypothetical protein